MKTYNFKDIVAFLPGVYEVSGDVNKFFFNNIKTIFEADEHSLVWLNPSRKDQDELLNTTEAKVIICKTGTKTLRSDKLFILVDNPKLTFLRIVDAIFATKPGFGVHPSSWVHQEAEINDKVYIGPFNNIGKVVIGEGTMIYSHCHIGDGTIIGKNVIIQHNTTIGSDGFGYSKNEKGEMERFPHIGGVIIEDNVEIGSNTCIDRGTLGNTILKKGCKVDNLVHIAHNVIIGENSCIIANAMIGGSTIIGKNAWISPSASLRDGIVLEDNALLGMGAVLVKNQPENSVWTGNPAKSLEELSLQNKAIKKLIDNSK